MSTPPCRYRTLIKIKMIRHATIRDTVIISIKIGWSAFGPAQNPGEAGHSGKKKLKKVQFS